MAATTPTGSSPWWRGLGLFGVAVVAVAAVAVAVSVAVAASDEDCSAPSGVAVDDDLWLQPFTEDSFWNAPLPAEWDVAGAASDPMTENLRQPTIESRDGQAEWPTRTWLNHLAYSMPVVRADWCDPVVTLDEENSDPRGETVGEVRVPADAEPAVGTDAHLLVVQPDGRTAVELFGAEKLADDRWAVLRVETVDLAGDGGGPDNGVRAYGGSALGGLIRAWEVDPEHPRYVDGVIRHGLAVSLPSGMLFYAEGDPGYDQRGYGTALGYVWPATEQDYNSPWEYYGTIPMGARVALPRSVDVEALGLGPEARAIAVALQDYGGYVVDQTGDDTVGFYLEVDAPSSWAEAALAPSATGAQLAAIRSQLVVLPPG